MPSPPTLSTPSNLDMAEPRSMDDFGQTYRSTGILVSDRLSLPITVVEPSVVRWRWKLGEGEQMHFTVMFTAAEGASPSWKTKSRMAGQRRPSGRLTEAVRRPGAA